MQIPPPDHLEVPRFGQCASCGLCSRGRIHDVRPERQPAIRGAVWLAAAFAAHNNDNRQPTTMLHRSYYGRGRITKVIHAPFPMVGYVVVFSQDRPRQRPQTMAQRPSCAELALPRASGGSPDLESARFESSHGGTFARPSGPVTPLRSRKSGGCRGGERQPDPTQCTRMRPESHLRALLRHALRVTARGVMPYW